jgi:hypothetical protein
MIEIFQQFRHPSVKIGDCRKDESRSCSLPFGRKYFSKIEKEELENEAD